jgi:UDP-N-acetylmuramoyl-L-alanyl-D-glutamate--2,6-diaminopimelate ligase
MNLKTELMDRVPFYNKIVLPYHFLKAGLAGVRYGFPGKKMTVIGITGTNGKTSTAFLVWKMLSRAGYKTGLMTTVAWGGLPEMVGAEGDDGSLKAGEDGLHQQTKHMTTVDSMTLNRRMKTIYEAGAEFLVLEVTSHAMTQFRTLGIPIEVAGMTNLTHEHLDYHKTFEKYRAAKCKLFKKAKFGIANADDASAVFFMHEVKKGLTYGVKKGSLRARNIELSAEGVSYEVKGIEIERAEKAVGVTDDTKYKVSDFTIQTQIPGVFTVYNTLLAAGIGLRLGLNEAQIRDGIYALKSVEGRMNRIDLGQNFTAIVDYAHTPDAFLKVFESVAPNERGRIIAVFGGAGRRDETTRDERGEIAAKYADICIITEDDSRDEDPMAIAKMFLVGCERQGKTLDKEVLFELDRRKAIEKACAMAKKGDIVLILGKGHEKTILRKNGADPFEDLKETERAIKRILGK